MDHEKTAESQTSAEGCCRGEDDIFIKIPNPFRFVRGTQRFFQHPVFTHFRNAQVEFMRGVRDVVDYEIKQAEKGMNESAAEYEARQAAEG